MSKKTRKKSSKASRPEDDRAATARSGQNAANAKSRGEGAPAPARQSRKKAAKTTGRSIAARPAQQIRQIERPRDNRPPLAATAPRPARAMPSRKVADRLTTPRPLAASRLTEGAKAPAFRLPRDGGGTVSLSDYSGKKLVLFFYPRADTPGLHQGGHRLHAPVGAFAESQTAVLGVSADPPKAQEAFRDKHQLVHSSASRMNNIRCWRRMASGAKNPCMAGPSMGILRTTVLIGADGRIVRIWRNVKVDGHADEVLAAVQALVI